MASPSIVVEQVKTSGSAESDLYTVPSGRRASARVWVSTVTAAAVSVMLRKAGATLADVHYLTRDEAVGANSGAVFGPILLAAGDVVSVDSDQTDTAWTLNGYEDDA